MIIDAVFIVASCGDSKRVSAIGLIPEIDPLTEGHIRLYFFRSSAVLLFQLFQLIGTFCFCFRRYAFCNRQAFLIVPDNNSSFPPTVLSFSESSFPLRSFFIQRTSPSCCNIVVLLAWSASQYSLLRHSFLLAVSATGGARKRPPRHFFFFSDWYHLLQA